VQDRYLRRQSTPELIQEISAERYGALAPEKFKPEKCGE
jgi:hypothetical protein